MAGGDHQATKASNRHDVLSPTDRFRGPEQNFRYKLTLRIVYDPPMISEGERETLRSWFAAFEPAVDVELTDDAVFVRSSRPHRSGEVVRCGRTNDLHQDLNRGLSQLVERMS